MNSFWGLGSCFSHVFLLYSLSEVITVRICLSFLSLLFPSLPFPSFPFPSFSFLAPTPVSDQESSSASYQGLGKHIAPQPRLAFFLESSTCALSWLLLSTNGTFSGKVETTTAHSSHVSTFPLTGCSVFSFMKSYCYLLSVSS